MKDLKPVIIGRIPHRGHMFTMWVDITAAPCRYYVELKISPQYGDGIVESEAYLRRCFSSSMLAAGASSTGGGRYFATARKARAAAKVFKAWLRAKTALEKPKRCGSGTECSDPMRSMSRRVGCSDDAH